MKRIALLLLTLIAPMAFAAGNPISVTPALLAFTNVTVGTTSATQAVTVKNTGAASSVSTGTAAKGTTTSTTGVITSLKVAITTNFVQTNNCPASLNPAATCTINVAFKAPSLAGIYVGLLTVSGTVTTTTVTHTTPPGGKTKTTTTSTVNTYISSVPMAGTAIPAPPKSKS